jgi:putative chitinase
MLFHCNLSLDILSKLIPNNKNAVIWLNALVSTLPKYDIITKVRVASFLAQTIYESSEFTRLEENLNYGEQGLLATFPKYFDTAKAIAYAREPEHIANYVYANRYGNGPESSGDGWKYRGRGLIQITFKANYEACSQALFNDLRYVDNPESLSQPSGAVLSACWFWDVHKLNSLADNDNFAAITTRINGGQAGETIRVSNFYKAMNLL